MRLTKIDLHGFKSFFHRTSLELPVGISAVVGPNGCGKSNIADAIRWVMGEQSPRKLRGKAMEDVIFAGSAKNRSLGLAEVSLSLVRTETPFPSPYHHYTELTVTRRLYRSGEAEYLINKIPCRRKDILHLLMDTGLGSRGYAIIEQGSIGRIVDSGPEERRAWVEEAAGVVKFKAQRLAANRKMEATTHNLERVADILSEVERQSASLKRQAQKAKRHQRYTARVEELELALAAARYQDLSTRITDQDRSEHELNLEREKLIGRESGESTSLQADRLTLSQAESALAKRREERLKLGNLIRTIEQEAIHLGEKEEDLKLRREQDKRGSIEEAERLAELTEELDQVGLRRAELDRELAARQDQVAVAQERLEQAKGLVTELTANVSRTKDRLIDLASRRAGANNALLTAKERLGSVQARLNRLDEQAEQAREERAELAREVEAGEDSLREFEDRLESLEMDQETAREAIGMATEEANLVRSQMDEISSRARRTEAELEGLEALAGKFEGVTEGVKALMTSDKLRAEFDQPPFAGLLAESIVTPPELEPAVEAALSGGTDYIVAHGPKQVLAGLDLLREEETGRASLSAEGLLSPETGPDPPPPGAELLAAKIEFSGPGAKIAAAVVGQTLLAPDLLSGLKAWRDDGRKRPVVTLAGELIAPPGIVTGGRATEQKASLLARQRAIRELAETLESIRAEERAKTSEIEAAEERLALEKEHLDALVEQVRAEEAAKTEAEREFSKKAVKLEELSRLDKILASEAEAIEEDRVRQEAILEEQEIILEEVEADQARLDETLSLADEEVRQATEESADRMEELTDLKIVSSSLLQQRDQLAQEAVRVDRDQRRSEVRLAGLKNQIEQAAKDIEACRTKVAKGREEIKRLTVEAGRSDEELEAESDQLDRTREELDLREEKLNLLRAEIRELDEKIRESGLSLSETKADLRHLVESIQERYQIHLAAEAENYLDPELDREESEAEVAELKTKLKNLGPVNPTAVEEYQALEERRIFLVEQVEDLTASLEDLKRAIRKINQTSIERFMETFRSVASRMQELAPILFGEEAIAELILVDPDNPLESGVDIRVQPSGKRLVNMSLLSGGEKALTAVTLLFAIFLHKPSPFCLLDEVDAPLDENNVDRFNRLVREIGKQSQILMITHNRRTMEVVDTLYGVTMPEPGVSRLVSVRLDSNTDELDGLVQ